MKSFKQHLEEGSGPTRKHFQQVADLIKTHPDATKRKELALHHASIFATQNTRFDKKKFLSAANVTEEAVNEPTLHAYDVHHRGKKIDTVHYASHSDPTEVRDSLIKHDNYPANIYVTKRKRHGVPKGVIVGIKPNPKDRGLKKEDIGEGRGDNPALYHQTQIAKKTLKMSDVGARIMGGMNKDDARVHLKKQGWSDAKIQKHEDSLSEGQEDYKTASPFKGKANRFAPSTSTQDKIEHHRAEWHRLGISPNKSEATKDAMRWHAAELHRLLQHRRKSAKSSTVSESSTHRVMQTYLDNEKHNDHTANLVHLAKHYGNKGHQQKAAHLASELKRHGYNVHPEASAKLHKKLWPQLAAAYADHKAAHSASKLVKEDEETESLDVSTPSVDAIAKKHGVSVEQIEAQLKKGIEVETEHTTDAVTAKEIALDHLNEKPDYYTQLAKVEGRTINPTTLAVRQEQRRRQ